MIWIIPLGLLMVFFIFRYIHFNIHLPLLTIISVIEKLVVGDLDFELTQPVGRQRKNEIGRLLLALKKLQLTTRKNADFAEEITQGHMETSFHVLGEKDSMGNSLLSLRENLSSLINETKRAVYAAGSKGMLEVRIDIDGKHGVWKELSGGINDLLDSISLPFKSLNDIVQKIAQGDLSMRYEQHSTGDILLLKENLNQALDNLNDLLIEITSNVDRISDSSEEMLTVSVEMYNNTEEIASSISEMSNGAQGQLSNVEESSRLIQDIQTSSDDIGQQANRIHEAAQEGVENSTDGLKMIHQVSGSISDIATFAEATNNSIFALTESTKQISGVLRVITEISAQTNLLALNAAIEAAQAGEAGRGFSVVAEEIRKLAEDSRKSVKEIETLVSNVDKNSEMTSSSLKDLNKSITLGEESSVNASEAFEKISVSTSETLEISKDILTSSNNQISNIKGILDLAEGVVVIAEQTAAGTEEIASSTTELSSGMKNHTDKAEIVVEITKGLKGKVSKFRLSSEMESTPDEAEDIEYFEEQEMGQ